MPLVLSFDIGYASIGWCVLSSEKLADPDFLGTGVVTFPSDDCLASQRRGLRRTRRHIRSTRQRIGNMKKWLQHRNVLTRADLDKPGHPAPFLLAAAALQGHKTLNAWELWTVLRWYAHNRGYDGNSRWSREEITEEDSKKEIIAHALMEKHRTGTMCETVCACLNLNPAKYNKTISSHLPYKTLDAAYPRRVVEKETSELISKHIGKIPHFDVTTARFLLKNEALTGEERKTLASAGIKLPERYFGGLLFGQLVPRFDNRIIARCPITWANEYDNGIAAGKTDAEARKQADKFAKVPAAKSKEFLEYRFARILANLRADGQPIDKALRAELLDLARQQGRLTHPDLSKTIKARLGEVPTNLDAYFKLHPDAEEALVLDPVADLIRKSEGTRSKLSAIWRLLSDSAKENIVVQWRKNKAVSYAFIAQVSGDDPSVLEAFNVEHAAIRPKKGQPVPDFDTWLIRTKVAPDIPTGRAPYARPVLRQVVTEVLAGCDPTKPAKSTAHPEGESKPADGILYSLLDPTSRVRQLQAERPLDQLTNNHLVRHRLLILDRLITDLLAEFPTLSEQNTRVVVEVGRELKEFSGKTAKEISAELNNRLKDFKSAVKYLGDNAPDLSLTGSLIRKCRIAMDLGWKCPFTGEKYEPHQLKDLEREHIIPYASRNTNALHALVLTWPEINRWKRKRTARQFILDEGGKHVPNNPRLSIFTLKQYETFVNSLDTKGHLDDYHRKKARKALLLVTNFEDKELGFTDGAMTQTSHLMKLAMRGIGKTLPAASCDPIPGAVTAEIRRSWNLLGTLALACPEAIDSSGKAKPKDEIRSLTHLHHALDAATLALTIHYFPLIRHGENQSGLLWQAMLKRSKPPAEISLLLQTQRYKSTTRTGKDGNPRPDAEMIDLPADVKNALARSLAESRVMQHVPADRSGTKAKLTTWGILSIDGEGSDARIKLHQRTSTIEDGQRKIQTKTREERAAKLLGPQPKNGTGKLKAIKGAMIIGENYGLALDPVPTVIPFHDVTATLATLRAANGGKPVRILRNGMLIKILSGPNKGIWKIFSAMGNMKLKIAPLGYVTWDEKRIGSKKLALLPLIKAGLQILPHRYTGYPITD